MLLQITEPGVSLPKDSLPEIAIGIDLGTTNSLVAFSENGQVQIFAEAATGNCLLPSVVHYGNETIRSIKRLMGKSFKEAKNLGYTFFPYDESKQEGLVHLKIQDHSLSPIEISSVILKTLKNRAETALNRPIHKAVITVPAYFDEAARKATRDAAILAGLEVLRIINEPTAAALAYALDHQAEGIYAIYDLGGGTFDISILKLTKGIFQVLATGGNTTLGGDDFDKKIADHLANTPSDISQEDLLRARTLKESFSNNAKKSSSSLDRTTFKMLLTPYIKQTLDIMEETLKDAEITQKDLKGVVLVGGSTRISLISQMIEERFNIKVLTSINPDEAIVRGAALQAEALTRGSNALLLDVVPLSLGLEIMGDIVEKVIPRNSPIPIAKAQDFTTYQDGQTAMQIHVVQGEREMVKDCRSLAYFTLTGIPPMLAGQARIRITFTVDADGLLTVTAQEKTTGTQQHVDIKPSYGLFPEKIADLLRDSLEHGKEDMEKRLLIQARVKAEQLLKAVQTALEQDSHLLENNEHSAIETKFLSLQSLVSSTDRKVLVFACDALEKVTQNFAERRMENTIRQALKGKSLKKPQKTL